MEKQLASDLTTVEERLALLQERHNLLRTRESRAQALMTVREAADFGEGDAGDLFERWETQVMEREDEGGCSDPGVGDALEDEFLEAEEEGALRDELARLRAPNPGEAETGR